MKKLLFLLGAAVMAVGCTDNQPVPATISGELSGMDAEDSLLVFYNNAKDTIAVHNGAFTFEYPDTVVGAVNFFNYPKKTAAGTVKAISMKPIRVMMFPNVPVQLKGDFDHYTVTGGKFYDEYNKFYETIAEVEAEKQKATEEYLTLARSEEGASSKDKLDSLFQVVKAIDVKRLEGMEEYVAAHLDSEVSLYLLNYNRPKFGDKYIEELSDAVKNGAMKSIYEETAAFYAKMKAKKQAAELIQEGKPAPDFTLKNINGEDFTLSSLKGKFVVLDFWGSWCGWCIKGMPDMKAIYEKYQGKLEIVGIDCNDPEDKWKAAVEKHGMTWTNVINSKEVAKDLTTIYNVNGFPTKIILSPEGNILKIVVGESPEFYDAIKKLVK